MGVGTCGSPDIPGIALGGHAGNRIPADAWDPPPRSLGIASDPWGYPGGSWGAWGSRSLFGPSVFYYAPRKQLRCQILFLVCRADQPAPSAGTRVLPAAELALSAGTRDGRWPATSTQRGNPQRISAVSLHPTRELAMGADQPAPSGAWALREPLNITMGIPMARAPGALGSHNLMQRAHGAATGTHHGACGAGWTFRLPHVAGWWGAARGQTHLKIKKTIFCFINATSTSPMAMFVTRKEVKPGARWIPPLEVKACPPPK